MRDYSKSFHILMKDEGGFNLHHISYDSGGETYAGITKKFYPNWAGWKFLKNNDSRLRGAVYEFYEVHYWDKIKADLYDNFYIKEIVFNFAVNVGIRTAIKLMQKILGTATDGIIGPITIKALNNFDSEKFILKYTIEKISKYASICNNNSSQKKFLLGWINRSLRGLRNYKK